SLAAAAAARPAPARQPRLPFPLRPPPAPPPPHADAVDQLQHLAAAVRSLLRDNRERGGLARRARTPRAGDAGARPRRGRVNTRAARWRPTRASSGSRSASW